jgi:hypothetical protein
MQSTPRTDKADATKTLPAERFRQTILTRTLRLDEQPAQGRKTKKTREDSENQNDRKH